VRAFALRALALAIVLPLRASLPYRAPVASDFLVEIFSPLQSWNCCTSLRSVSASAVFSVCNERSSAKAWWFHHESGAFLTLWEIPVESNSRRRALINRLNRSGERTEPWTIPVSNWMAAVPSPPTCTRIEEFSLMFLRSQTSGTPNPFRIVHRHEWPAELKAFLKSRSTRMSVPSFFIASRISQLAFWMTSWTALEFLHPNCEDSWNQ